MSRAFAEIAFTPSVKAAQARDGSRGSYERALGRDPQHEPARLGDDERAFIEEQRSFFMASVSETGWPYVQHRGGPPGFLHVIDEQAVRFVDLAGNRQFISVGNVSRDDRVALIFVDYANQARLKLLGHLSMREVEPDDPELAGLLPPELRPLAKRIMTIRVAAFDWNCSQYIPLLLSPEDMAAELKSQGPAGEH
jgi:predicted pyridoxine 5'-phosphate oxidase superfamily flavin-nucleotide-binding protein